MSVLQQDAITYEYFGARYTMTGLPTTVIQILDSYVDRAPDGDSAEVVSIERAGGTFRTAWADGRVQPSRSEDDLVDYLLWTMHDDHLSSVETTHLAIHAAAVLGRYGAVLLPGAPDAGKTTLATGLARAGYGYVTDEVVQIRPCEGTVEPYPRAPVLEPPAIDVIVGLRTDMESRLCRTSGRNPRVPLELVGGATRGCHPIQAVVFPTYRSGQATRIERISRAEATVRLLRNSFNASRFRARAVTLVGEAVKGAVTYSLETGPLPDAIRTLQAVIGDPPPERHEYVDATAAVVS